MLGGNLSINEAKKNTERLSEIEKSRRYRESLKQKHGTGGLPSDYKETEQEAFKKADEWKAANPEVTHINKFVRKRYVPEELPENLRYPYSTIDDTQDFIKFSIFTYKRDGMVTRGSTVGEEQEKLKADAELIKFSLGQPLCKKEIIPNKIFIIL